LSVLFWGHHTLISNEVGPNVCVREEESNQQHFYKTIFLCHDLGLFIDVPFTEKTHFRIDHFDLNLFFFIYCTRISRAESSLQFPFLYKNVKIHFSETERILFYCSFWWVSSYSFQIIIHCRMKALHEFISKILFRYVKDPRLNFQILLE
jgi:hypothetical protein